MWRPVDNLRELVLSFHHVGSGVQTQVASYVQQAHLATESSQWL